MISFLTICFNKGACFFFSYPCGTVDCTVDCVPHQLSVLIMRAAFSAAAVGTSLLARHMVVAQGIARCTASAAATTTLPSFSSVGLKEREVRRPVVAVCQVMIEIDPARLTHPPVSTCSTCLTLHISVSHCSSLPRALPLAACLSLGHSQPSCLSSDHTCNKCVKTTFMSVKTTFRSAQTTKSMCASVSVTHSRPRCHCTTSATP